MRSAFWFVHQISDLLWKLIVYDIRFTWERSSQLLLNNEKLVCAICFKVGGRILKHYKCLRLFIPYIITTWKGNNPFTFQISNHYINFCWILKLGEMRPDFDRCFRFVTSLGYNVVVFMSYHFLLDGNIAFAFKFLCSNEVPINIKISDLQIVPNHLWNQYIKNVMFRYFL